MNARGGTLIEIGKSITNDGVHPVLEAEAKVVAKPKEAVTTDGKFW